MAITISEEVVVEGSADDVWPFVADADQELRWRGPIVQSLEPIGSGDMRVGSRFRGTTKYMGTTETYETEITEIAAPHRVEWRGTEASGPIVGSGSYEIEPTGDGRSRVRINMEYEATRGGGRLMLPVMKLVGPRILRRFLATLRSLVESGASASTP